MPKKYGTLKIENDWSTRFKLGKISLDFDKFYDVKLPDGRTFEGCEVYCHTDYHHGSGGMSESSSSSVGFFKASGLEIKLNSGMMLRVNEKVTSQKNAEEAKKQKQDELRYFYQQKNTLNKKISRLKRKK